ncbi:MAG: hypothetical protein PHG08_00270 [Bacilli bacterium]|nr:hypothetical protein [Bacilli bacterium]
MTKRISIFDDISNDAGSRARSYQWYMDKIKELQGRGLVSKNKLTSNYTNMVTSNLEIGSMYMFVYSDPKYKDKLPYYDAFPIILPFGMDAEHFTGYNLHYLPPRARWIILKKLMVNDELSTIRRLSKEVRLSMDYQMLKGASSFAELKPCIHQYLFSHVGQINGGAFIKIHPAEWNFSVLLPVQDFKSRNRSFSAETVWANSMRSR